MAMRIAGAPRVIAHASGASTSASTVPPPCPWLSSGHCCANDGSFGTCRRAGPGAWPAALVARTMPASQVAPSALLFAQDVVPTMPPAVSDAANDELVGAERHVALRELAAAQIRNGL